MDAILETFGALLRIAQIESGMPTRRFVTVDLSELLHTVIEVYQPMADEREQRFTADIAAGLTVRGDRELLAQMIANVLENAMKHSPTGASVSLRTSQSPGAIAVAVIDSGPGIPVADRTRVFKRFYRLERSRSTPGSGLGLSLAAAIAAVHQASIELTDNNPGLRVTLRFSRHANDLVTEIAPPSERASERYPEVALPFAGINSGRRRGVWEPI